MFIFYSRHTKHNADAIKVKHEKSTNDLEEDVNVRKEPKAKKRKYKDGENSFDEVESPKKKKIKTEAESDSDAKKKKKKKSNMTNINGHVSNSNESDRQDNDDEYLNVRVKQEQEYQKSSNHTKSKKSKKEHDNNFETKDSGHEKESEEYVPKKEKKSKKKKKHSSKEISANSFGENDLSYDQNNSQCMDDNEGGTYEPSKKSPKKKKSNEIRLSERFSSPDIEDKFSAEETIVQKKHKQTNASNTNEEPIGNDHSSNLEDNMDESQTNLNNHKPKQLQNNSMNDTSNSIIASSQNSLPKKKTLIKTMVQSTPNNAGIQSKNNPARLLDRIRFEEDPDSDTDVIRENNDTSSFLKKFLQQNENLQPISKIFQNGSAITNDDEIWILKCPHDIDVQKLHNTDFQLDSKSKIKINGETYCGNLDENETKITVMTSNKNNFIIKNIVANGTIHFRKRLPKPHVQEDNVMVNNQTDFIPLPETKCRHPLFGSNYKDAINVRVRRPRADSAVTDLEVSTIHEKKKKKKKHKKDHEIEPKVEIDKEMSLEKSPKIENEPDVLVKKAKKRKHTSNDESYKKKSKRIKLEPDSAEAWESEKAIEENLFNF